MGKKEDFSQFLKDCKLDFIGLKKHSTVEGFSSELQNIYNRWVDDNTEKTFCCEECGSETRVISKKIVSVELDMPDPEPVQAVAERQCVECDWKGWPYKHPQVEKDT